MNEKSVLVSRALGEMIERGFFVAVQDPDGRLKVEQAMQALWEVLDEMEQEKRRKPTHLRLVH